ncbi:MAG: hypothetical protein WC789_10275 [Lentisphaeria bacterium]
MTRLEYDLAGRLLGAAGGTKTVYGWLDKAVARRGADGRELARFHYWPDGQLAWKDLPGPAVGPAVQAAPRRAGDGAVPEFQAASSAAQMAGEALLWDGLALLRKDATVYVAEPHVSGGVPVCSRQVGEAAPDCWYLTDLLGTTVATMHGPAVALTKLTAFGQPLRQGAPGLAPEAPQVEVPDGAAPEAR